MVSKTTISEVMRELGRRGGKVRSEAKARAARRNGKLAVTKIVVDKGKKRAQSRPIIPRAKRDQ